MKKILIIICLMFFSMGIKARVTGIVLPNEYEEIVNSELVKSQLWSNLKRWIAVNFVSYKHSVDLEDGENGSMIVKFCITDDDANDYVSATISALLQVDVKDMKYRIKLNATNFEFKPKDKLDGDMRYMSTASLNMAEAQLQAAVNLGDIVSFTDLQTTTSAYAKLLKETPKYLTPRDEKKGKINPVYLKYSYTAGLGYHLQNMYYDNEFKIVDSLKESMTNSNDF